MKIAFITADGETISKHFGRAPYFLVVTVENGQVVDRELREKPGHTQFASQDQSDYRHGEPHGFEAGFHTRHVRIAQVIADCMVVVCAGMGVAAYESLEMLNIRPIVTDQRMIDEALRLYLAGQLKHRPERLD